MQNRVTILLILVLACWGKVFSQEKPILFFQPVDSLNGEQFEQKEFGSNDKLNAWLTDWVNGKRAKGFAEASIDSVSRSGDSTWVWYHTGKKFILSSLSFDLDEYVEKDLKLHEKSFRDTKLDFSALESIPEKALILYENSGYPFAQVKYKTESVENDSFALSLIAEKGPLVTFDSLNNPLKAKISTKLLKAYLGISSGDVYNESLVRNLDKNLSKLPYVTIRQPSRILFHEDKADIQVFLERKKVNLFDFLIGVAPKNSITGKVSFTGEARIHLWNAFGRGEKLYIDWQKLERSSQNLQLLFQYPYLLGTTLGVNTDFSLRKRDTSHVDLIWSLGLPYQFSGNNYIKLYFQNFQTIVLQPDTSYSIRNLKLPPLQDVSTAMYGGEVYYETLDNLLSPKKGYEFFASGALGTKKIKRNNAFSEINSPLHPEYNFDNLYDSIDLKTLQGNISWLANAYLQPGRRHVFKLGIQGKGLFNKNILENELYRIGGGKLLRGFDEESIHASLYSILTAEYRFLLDQNSYFYIFFDGAYTERRLPDDYTRDFPFGFGAGMNFTTKIGIFGLSYAMGRQQDNPLDFRGAKIHFGYLNYF